MASNTQVTLVIMYTARLTFNDIISSTQCTCTAHKKRRLFSISCIRAPRGWHSCLVFRMLGGSNLHLGTGCLPLSLSWIFSVNSGKCRGSTASVLYALILTVVKCINNKYTNNSCALKNSYRSRDFSVGIVTGYGLNAGASIPGRSKGLFSTASRPSLKPAQIPIQWVPGVKRPRLEADQSLASSAEIKNGGRMPPFPYTSSWHGA
jgi:hypothetical protein